MRDNFQIPNFGTPTESYDKGFMARLIRTLEFVLTDLRSAGPQTSTSMILAPVTVAALPTGRPGMVAYASNGRKHGEGSGSGTGVLVFYDGSAWCASDTGLPVSI